MFKGSGLGEGTGPEGVVSEAGAKVGVFLKKHADD